MSAFIVKVCTAKSRVEYEAIGTSSAAVHQAALDLFGGLCSVVVIPLKDTTAIAQDDGGRPGTVRTRAVAHDPYTGLRGRDYIVGRGLDKPIRRVAPIASEVDAVPLLPCLIRTREEA